MNKTKILNLFSKPGIIGVIGDTNTAKSMLIYNIINIVTDTYKPSIYTYGLKAHISNSQEIYSVKELEEVQNSIIVVDEFINLFDVDNRKIRKQIENTIRLIHHNNNVLILAGLAVNYKKFIAAKLDVVMFKKVTIADAINGSKVKEIITQYNGIEKGSSILNIPINKVLVYDNKHYSMLNVEYLQNYDSKAKNQPILKKK